MAKMAFSETVTFNVQECTCGVRYAVTDEYEAARRKDHAGFYCPNGHPRYYPQETAEEKLRAEKLRLESQLEFARQQRDAAQAERDKAERKVKRITKRANAGMCMDCGRWFVQVARHRATKHGDAGCKAMTAKNP